MLEPSGVIVSREGGDKLDNNSIMEEHEVNNEKLKVLLKIFSEYSKLFKKAADVGHIQITIDGESKFVCKDVKYGKARVFDAIARILAIQEPCTSICATGKIWKISFNKNASENTIFIVNRFFNLINDYGQNKERKKDIYVLALHSSKDFRVSCTEFNAAYNSNKSNVHKDLFQKLIDFINKYLNLFPNKKIKFDKEKFEEKTKLLVDPYTVFYPVLKVGESFRETYFALITCWYRITQDVEKVLYALKFYELNIPEKPYFVDNSPQYHAEIALVQDLTELTIDKSIEYIGISRLCCKLCDTTLRLLNIDHLGSHNMMYAGTSYCEKDYEKRINKEGWKIPANKLDENMVQRLIDVIKIYFQKNILKYYPSINYIEKPNDDENVKFLKEILEKNPETNDSNDFSKDFNADVSDDEDIECKIRLSNDSMESLSAFKNYLRQNLKEAHVKNCLLK